MPDITLFCAAWDEVPKPASEEWVKDGHNSYNSFLLFLFPFFFSLVIFQIDILVKLFILILNTEFLQGYS